MTPDDLSQIAYAGYVAYCQVRKTPPLSFTRWQGAEQTAWASAARAMEATRRELARDAAEKDKAAQAAIAAADAFARRTVRLACPQPQRGRTT